MKPTPPLRGHASEMIAERAACGRCCAGHACEADMGNPLTRQGGAETAIPGALSQNGE